MRGLLALVWSKRWHLFAGLLVLLVVDAGQLVVPLILRKEVDSIALGLATESELLFWAVVLVAIALVVGFFRFFWRYFILGASRLIERQLRERLYKHITILHPGFFNETSSGDLMALATNDVEAVRMAAGMGFIAAADALIYGVFSLAVMFSISFTLTLYILIPLVVLLFIELAFGRLIHSRFKRVQETFARITEFVREMLSGVRVTRAFVQEKGTERAFSRLNEDYISINMSLIRVWGLFFPLITFLSGIAWATIVWQGGAMTIYGQMSLGDVVAFISYLGMLVWPMIATGWVVNLVQRGSASLKRLEKVLHEAPAIQSTGNVKETVLGCIEARSLTFAFEEGRPALKDVSFRVEPGQTLGVVGRTGSGKSTLVSLIARMEVFPRGMLFIDGRDVHDYDLRHLRSSIAFVPQEPFLFSDTIEGNIALGKPDTPRDRIVEAARAAQVWSEIEEMPDGLETIVGERGVTLSGGQRQRIALARALLSDAPVLILDDVLSAVDAQTEETILANLKAHTRDLTTIIVSHRISSVAAADSIIVLRRGRLVEKGNHDELIRVEGTYSNLWQLQQLGAHLVG